MDSLDQLYAEALTTMERFVHRLAKRVPPPQRVAHVAHKGAFVFRHVEKLIGQAIVQKLAPMVSTLHAARLLQNHGFVQEQGALQRILDEIQYDIYILAFAVIYNDRTPLHQRYLDAFFEEEFDAADALESTQKRPMIPRKKIFAYLARKTGPGLDSCMRARRAGDVPVVWKLARLGRNLAHSVNTVQTLSARGVGLRVLTGQGAQIDTTTATPPCPRSAANLGSPPWRFTGTSGRKASCASKARRFSPLESARASADGWA